MNEPTQPDRENALDASEGIIVALLERMRTQRLPRILSMKEKVDAGERLDSFDIHFLNEAFEDAQHQSSVWGQHPEFEDIVASVVHLYHEITSKALENEERAVQAEGRVLPEDGASPLS